MTPVGKIGGPLKTIAALEMMQTRQISPHLYFDIVDVLAEIHYNLGVVCIVFAVFNFD